MVAVDERTERVRALVDRAAPVHSGRPAGRVLRQRDPESTRPVSAISRVVGRMPPRAKICRAREEQRDTPATSRIAAAELGRSMRHRQRSPVDERERSRTPPRRRRDDRDHAARQRDELQREAASTANSPDRGCMGREDRTNRGERRRRRARTGTRRTPQSCRRTPTRHEPGAGERRGPGAIAGIGATRRVWP